MKRRAWLGGYRRQSKKGEVFVIERWVNGRKFHVSTRCTSERAALKQLEVFEANPIAYKPDGVAPRAALRLDADLIDKHERFQIEVKKNTKNHVACCGKYLVDWMEAFDGADLRDLTTQDLKALLRKWKTAKRYRVLAIKGFCTWLRTEEGLLKNSEDPAVDLDMPAFKPAKFSRPKVIEQTVVLEVLGLLKGAPRDVLRLLAGTGIHISEARRFAKEGEVFERTPEQDTEVLANITFKHKSGQPHVVAISDSEVLDAARRLKAAGNIPNSSYLAKLMRNASDAAGIKPRVTLGVMRHSVATWLARDGVPLAQIADFLGHQSPVTTAKFYRDMGRTARALPVPRLRLVVSNTG
jgi:integrase